MIPYGRQNIDESDVLAVTAALNSEYLTQGPRVQDFEIALAANVGASHAIAVNSATSALHLACLALGVGPGDAVWTSAISFVASANAARYCGADVDFVDIEKDTFNISVDALEEKLRVARSAGGKLPKVVIPVAMAGQSPDMVGIARLASEYDFKVIEDASHALGGRYRGNPVGSCEFSDITVFSFHPVKMITTGEGGACVTNSTLLAAKIQRLRSHGITRDPAEMNATSPGLWYYEQLELGYNYRITDVQCALGRSQLFRLEDFVTTRNQIAEKYSSILTHDWLRLPKVRSDVTSSFHLFVVRFEKSSPLTRNKFFEIFRANGVLVNLHYIPIYRHPYYAGMNRYSVDDFPEAEEYFGSALSLPIFPGLRDDQLQQIASIFEQDFGYQTIF